MSDTPTELRRLLGADAVSTDEGDIDRHSTDQSPLALLARRSAQPLPAPACVARPADTGQVSELLAWAHSNSVPVTPFGGGSGVCGAILPDGGVVVDLTAMDRVIDVDETSRLVQAQAGISGPALTETLDKQGYHLGHEPQSLAISTLGGWIATRACGQLSAVHGGIDDIITSIEAVIPGGQILRSRATPRSATGPDIASLMIGSEGTLGIVTEATLRFVPRPTVRVDRAVRFNHMKEGVEAVRAIAQSHLHPTLVRLYDMEDTVIAFRALSPPPEGPLLLLSFEDDAASDHRADAAVELAAGEPMDPAVVAHWWEHRNDAVDSYLELMSGRGLLGPHAIVDTMEVSGTWGSLRALYHAMKDALSAEADIVGCHLSHVYADGACLYFTLGAAAEDDESAGALNERWWEIGMAACLRNGGSISHHHGIGRLKARWLEAELGGWWKVLVAVKKAIDPRGIMNPGALGL